MIGDKPEPIHDLDNNANDENDNDNGNGNGNGNGSGNGSKYQTEQDKKAHESILQEHHLEQLSSMVIEHHEKQDKAKQGK